MEILVCVKQVPGTMQVEVDPVTGVLKRDGVPSKLNPYDLYAIETALRLAERGGGRVRALSMGPMQAKQAVLEAVAMGAESGTLVSDRRFGGSDVLATSYTLSQAVGQLGDVDLILCGKQTTDGDTAQVGAEMAEFLGWPHANNVQSIELDGEGFLKLRVNLERHTATLRMPMPCVLCVDSDTGTPRLPSYRRKKAITENCLHVLTLDDFADSDASHYGLHSSPTQVERIFPPEKNTEKEIFSGTGEEMAAQLAAVLQRRKLV